MLARIDGKAVGCGGILLADGYAEIKRLFVLPTARGQRIGEQVLAWLENHARANGYQRAMLETGDRQPEALRLYERTGYARCGRFGDYEDDPLSVFYSKDLTTSANAASGEPTAATAERKLEVTMETKFDSPVRRLLSLGPEHSLLLLREAEQELVQLQLKDAVYSQLAAKTRFGWTSACWSGDDSKALFAASSQRVFSLDYPPNAEADPDYDENGNQIGRAHV